MNNALCKDLHNKEKAASVNAFSFDSPSICLSKLAFLNFPENSVEKEIIGLLFHEFTHLLGFNESDANDFQKFAIAYYDFLFPPTPNALNLFTSTKTIVHTIEVISSLRSLRKIDDKINKKPIARINEHLLVQHFFKLYMDRIVLAQVADQYWRRIELYEKVYKQNWQLERESLLKLNSVLSEIESIIEIYLALPVAYISFFEIVDVHPLNSICDWGDSFMQNSLEERRKEFIVENNSDMDSVEVLCKNPNDLLKEDIFFVLDRLNTKIKYDLTDFLQYNVYWFLANEKKQP